MNLSEIISYKSEINTMKKITWRTDNKIASITDVNEESDKTTIKLDNSIG